MRNRHRAKISLLVATVEGYNEKMDAKYLPPTPVRVQRKRTKGYKLPPNTVYVGRPTKWGNPFKVGDIIRDENSKRIPATIEDCLFMYEIKIGVDVLRGTVDLSELKGKNLACFCSLDQPCHADILLRLANNS